MRVKIGNKIYDSEIVPIMIILSKEEKEQISNMCKNDDCYLVCLKTNNLFQNNREKMLTWMKDI